VLSDVLSDQRSDLHWFPPHAAEGIGFWSETLGAAGIAFAAADIPSGGDPGAMVRVLKNNIDDYVIDGFPKRAVEAAKRRAIVHLESERGSVRALALAWAQAVAVEGRSSPDDDVGAIQDVSVDDVNRVAAEYLNSKEAVVGTLLPATSTTTVLKGFAAARGSAESVIPEVGRAAPSLPAWAQPADQVTVPRSSLQPVDERLPNGLRLIVQPESVSNTVIVLGAVSGVPILETPPGQEGVDFLLSQMFDEGPADVVDEDWTAQLDETGADLSSGRTFSVEMLASDFDRGVQLLADNELHPDITPDFFSLRRSEVGAAAVDAYSGPEARARLALDSGLFPPGDPALRVPTKASFDSISFQDVSDYYDRSFRPDLTTIVVVGAVTPDQARSVIEKYFGDWGARGPLPPLSLPGVPSNKAESTVVPALGHTQDDVWLAETVGVSPSDPDYDALQLANHVLAGGDQSTWLYRDVREDAGLAYSIDSILDTSDGRTLFAVHYGADPANVAKARDIIVRDLRDLETTALGADDIRRAKLLMLRHVPLDEQSMDSIAASLLDLALSGRPLDDRLRSAKRSMHLTAAQVRAAVAKWIRPDGFVQVVEGPPPN